MPSLAIATLLCVHADNKVSKARARGCVGSHYPFLTQKERDNETGLDYFNARYYASTQGRFTGADPLYIEIRRLPYPQAWNLYSYTRNNPLKYVDEDGLEVKVDCGASDGKIFKQCVEQTTTDLNNRKDAQFNVEIKDGKLAVIGSVDASKLSKSEGELYKAITDPKNVSELKIEMPGMNSAGIMFDQYIRPGVNVVDRADLNQLNRVDKRLSGEAIAHAAIEGYVGVAEGLATYDDAHARANEFFGNVTSTAAVGQPPGAAMSTSALKTYNFQRVGVSDHGKEIRHADSSAIGPRGWLVSHVGKSQSGFA